MANTSFAFVFWKKKLLMFHRDNIPTIPNPDCWALPGGVIEKGETPLTALKRELSEEVTFVPSEIHPIGVLKKDDGYLANLYVAFVEDKDAKRFKLGPGEGQEIKFIDIEKVLDLKLPPKFRQLYLNNLEELRNAIHKHDFTHNSD